MAKRATLLCALVFLAFSAGLAAAQPPVDAQRAAENKQISAAAKYGPADIALRDEAILHLPNGDIFLPQKEAAILMKRMGNFTNDRFMGLVVPATQDQNWFVDITYDDSGFVKDDEGKSIDADALLQKLKDTTVGENQRRRDQGMKEIEIVGWIEKPHYDAASHHLIWSLEIRNVGAPAGAATGVNYNTYALGRRGYISMDLVTARSLVDANKAQVRTLLSALSFNQGSRYGDFNAKTDKIAEYGLLALIGGVAVKKLGLLALAAAVIIKFIKLIVAACVGGWIAIKKFVLGKKKVPGLAPTEPRTAIPPAPE